MASASPSGRIPRASASFGLKARPRRLSAPSLVFLPNRAAIRHKRGHEIRFRSLPTDRPDRRGDDHRPVADLRAPVGRRAGGDRVLAAGVRRAVPGDPDGGGAALARAPTSKRFAFSPILLLAGLAFAGDLACWHYGIHYTSVTNATVLSNGTPILVTAAAWLFLKERPRRVFVIGMSLAIAGAVVMALAKGGGHPRARPQSAPRRRALSPHRRLVRRLFPGGARGAQDDGRQRGDVLVRHGRATGAGRHRASCCASRSFRWRRSAGRPASGSG